MDTTNNRLTIRSENREMREGLCLSISLFYAQTCKNNVKQQELRSERLEVGEGFSL